MNAKDFYDLKVKKAKGFGFPEPIFVNAEKLTDRTRVLYIVEIQATHISDKTKHKAHHYALKFSKFKKIKEEPFWIEEDLEKETGFSISDKASIEKLAAYIKANQALLNIDIFSKEYTSVILSNDAVTIDIVKRILESEKNKDAIYQLFKDQYPEFDKKILAYKLVQARKKSLEEFKVSLDDVNKKERDYWQPFLERNRWMFGLSYFVLLDESRIDLWDTADYLFESEDGFIDIVEIKHPHFEFWQKDAIGKYKKYRSYLQPSEELKGAITQATNYIFQLEKKFSDPDWQRKNHCGTPVKPSCTVIFGRSNNWDLEEKTAFRLLNDSLHGIDIITFDHLYSRAALLLQSLEKEN
ncbi:MAG: Shedu anti-phage system protein SduA domain-containing protein [Candidatus Omnitrophota bacterium]